MLYLSTISKIIFFFTLFLSPILAIKTASIGALNGIRDNLQLAGITPAILPKFRPAGVLTLSVGSLGVRLGKEDVKTLPALAYTPGKRDPMIKGGKMLLVMMDVDASILHFVSPNLLPSTSSFRNGSFSLLPSPSSASTSSSFSIPYQPPSPPPSSQTHKYLLLLFNQPPNLLPSSTTSSSTLSRTNFNLGGFMKSLKLGNPLSAHFFLVSGSLTSSNLSGIGGGTEMFGKGLTNPVDDSGKDSSAGGGEGVKQSTGISSRGSIEKGLVIIFVLFCITLI